MEDSTNKIIFLIVGIVAALLVVSFGFFVFRSARDKGNAVDSQITNKMDSIIESQYTQYANTDISGTQLLSLINETYGNSDYVFITVTNGGGNTTTYVADSSSLNKLPQATEDGLLAAATTKGNAAYVNPTGSFRATVSRDANGVITGLTFTQN